MSKTNRKFKGKAYRQGHEPCELELTRKRAEKRERLIRDQLRQAAYEEQKAMGYDQYAD